MNKETKFFLWGAGSLGVSMMKKLQNEGVEITGFIDSDRNKSGTVIDNILVYPPEYLETKRGNEKIFIYISSSFDDEIEKHLVEMGFRAPIDYFNLYKMYTLERGVGVTIEQIEAKLQYIRNDLLQGRFDRLEELDDHIWFYMNTPDCIDRFNLEKSISPLPDEEIQKRLTGVCNEESIRHGFNQYMILKQILKNHSFPLDRNAKLLDFGTGYGRILRFFVKDVNPSLLFGTDINVELIEWSKQNNKFGNFFVNEENPPTVFDSDTFDFIFSFSVFSHLSEASSLSWLRELKRLVKKEGILCLTIWAHPEITKSYHEKHFTSYDQLVKAYEQGDYCYSNIMYNNSSTYGEALIHPNYIYRVWGEEFIILDIVKYHPNSPNQYYVVLKKK